MVDQVKNALVEFEYKDVQTVELAKFIGFNDDELHMLNVFWEPVFNKSWIYLSPSMIIKDMGYSKLSNFYTQVMRANYIENIDYKSVTSDDSVVQSYNEFEQNSKCLLISTYKQAYKRGSKQKYYLVTGRTLKRMLMKAKTRRGDDICDYYLKVEELAVFMREYIHALHQHISNKQLEDATTKIEGMRIINDRVQNFINNTKALDKNSTFYVATSKIYAAQNIFKLGCIDSIGEKALKARLAQYNTGKTGDDLFYFCHLQEVYDAKTLDYTLKKITTSVKYNRNKEMVILHYDLLVELIKGVSEDHLTSYDLFNDIVKSGRYVTQLNKVPVIPPPIVFEHTITLIEQKNGEEVKSHTIDVNNLTDVQKRDYLIKAIEIFCSTGGTTYDHETEKNNSDKKITLIWKDLQTILKQICNVKNIYPSKWKDQLKNISTDSKSIQCIKWVKK